MFDFLIWWLATLVVGVAFMPMTGRMFARFRDGGWLFAKGIGIFVSGYLMWVLSCLHILKFTSLNCILVVLLCLLVNVFVFWHDKKTHFYQLVQWDKKIIIIEEVLFLLMFGFWAYLVSFDPAAYGTEKFMDYGFMTGMMRTEYMPPVDTWYSGEVLNYYYGGQYLATYMTKLSGVTAGVGYNLMRTMISSFAFVLPFSLVYQLLYSLQLRHKNKVSQWMASLGGLLSGLAVSFCGNMHYVFYSLIPSLTKEPGETIDYYYPNSTRYIGHNPQVKGDETIHEFPSYSSVLGDLHAHMVNIIFVLVVVGLALAWAMRMDKKGKVSLKEALLQPEILLIGFFTGMFRWTNFWDFPIYFVVGGCVVFFVNIRLYRKDAKRFWITTILQAFEVLAVGTIACLPFTLSFDAMASSVKFVHSHSAFYQLLILWGLPVAIVGTFIISRIVSYMRSIKRQALATEKANAKRKKKNVPEEELKKPEKAGLISFLTKMPMEDLFIFLMSLCAIGLVLMPEVVYVEDIYSGAYRANTMFKLTYQAFILFGFSLAYVLFRTLLMNGKVAKGCSYVALALVLLTAGYSGNAIKSQFGDVSDPSKQKGLDASIFVSDSFASDYEGIKWLNENVSGQPVVLEAQGDSYTGYERVSVATGLPTVMGWYVHEWLWRGDTDAIKERSADVKEIYTSGNKDRVKQLLSLYDVSYIYIGSLERQKYPGLNDALLQEIGEVAYSNGVDTYILKVQ